MAVRLTQEFVDQATDGTYCDDEIKGFRLYVRGKSKGFRLQCSIHSKATTKYIGSADKMTADEARRVALELREKLKNTKYSASAPKVVSQGEAQNLRVYIKNLEERIFFLERVITHFGFDEEFKQNEDSTFKGLLTMTNSTCSKILNL